MNDTCEWVDSPPGYSCKSRNQVGGFWSKSSVLLLTFLFTFVAGTILASSLENCMASEELGNTVICDDAGLFLCSTTLYVLIFMVTFSFVVKYAVNIIRLYPALRCPSDGERCGFS